MKLEDLPKRKTPFQVPDGYFDKLPVWIAGRLAKESPQPLFTSGRVLIPGIAVMIIGVVTFLVLQTNPTVESPESMLGTVETSALVSFLEQNDIDSYDGAVYELEGQALDSLEMEIYELYSDDIPEELVDEFVEPDTL